MDMKFKNSDFVKFDEKPVLSSTVNFQVKKGLIMILLICLFAVPAFTAELSSKFSYPKGLPCKVYSSTKLDCSRRRLASVPPMKDHMGVVDLDLSYNDQLNISTDTLPRMDNLETLDLSYQRNGLTLHGSPFKSTLSLKKLDISGNEGGLMSLPQSVFSELQELQELDISNSAVTTLPETVFSGLIKLTKLVIGGNVMDSLAESLFEGLTQLTHLQTSFLCVPVLFRCTFSTPLPASLFKNLVNLVYLDLFGLYYYKSKQFPFVELPHKLFANVTNLRHLDIRMNNLFNIHGALFANLKKLEFLDLSCNLLHSLPETFGQCLPNLRYLSMYLNRLTAMPCKALEGLQLLSFMSIEFNYFNYMTCSIANTTNLHTLGISFNYSHYVHDNSPVIWNETKWSEFITRLPPSASTLQLSLTLNTVFQTVTAGLLPKSSVSTITMNEPMPSLLPGMFPVSSDAEEFHLSVENDAFAMFSNLETLVILSYYTTFHLPQITAISKYAFRGLTHLKSLALTYIGLTTLPEAVEVLAKSLRHLDLSNNNIVQLQSNGILRLESLTVSHNPVSVLNLTSFDSVTNVLLSDPDHVIVSTYWNEAVRFIYFSVSLSPPDMPHQVHLYAPICTSSPALEEITFKKFLAIPRFAPQALWGDCSHVKSLVVGGLYDLDSGFFMYNHDNEISHFPRLEHLQVTNCRLSHLPQYLLESRSMLSLNVSKNNLVGISDLSHLVKIKSLDLSNNNIYSLRDVKGLHSLATLTHLDLSHNIIESLPPSIFQHLTNLTYLNMAENELGDLNAVKVLYGLQTLIVYRNRLTTLPSFVTKSANNFENIWFGENTFSCTCIIESLQRWILTDEKTYIDPESTYLCKDPASEDMYGITDFNLDCLMHLEYYIPPAFAGLILICICIATVYKYRWKIHYKYWLLFHRRRYQRYLNNDDDDDILNSDDEDDVDARGPREAPFMRRRYHAYVAYHRESEDWVADHLVATLEDGPGRYRLCLRERDIPATHYKLSGISQAIYEKCRKTIIVLSENFLDEGIGRYQLQVARMRLVEKNEDVIILVQVGEFPDEKKTMLLRQIMCNKGVLIWTEDPEGQELFWNQLRFKLRKPAQVDPRFEA